MKKLFLVLFFTLLVPAICFSEYCYDATIKSPTPFLGNHGEVFTLYDGSVWEVQYEYKYLYKYYPDVMICPNSSTMVVDGDALNVKWISGYTGSGGGDTTSQSQTTDPYFTMYSDLSVYIPCVTISGQDGNIQYFWVVLESYDGIPGTQLWKVADAGVLPSFSSPFTILFDNLTFVLLNTKYGYSLYNFTFTFYGIVGQELTWTLHSMDPL